jgi:hypothetical protein
MTKQADMTQILSDLKAKALRGGADISKWYANLDPTVRHSLIGAAGGAALAGGIAAATPRDREDKGGVVGPALLGALLGGAGGGLLSYGANLSSGNPGWWLGPNRRPIGARIFENTVLAPLAWHPLMFAGGIGGAWKARPIISEALKRMEGETFRSGMRVAKDVLRDGSRPFWKHPRVRAAAGKGMFKGSPRLRLAALPALAGLGYVGDKYLKGEW